MLQTIQKTRTKLQAYERGGLTSELSDKDLTSVSYFAFCRHCDIETPIDNLNTCTYCFHQVSDDEDE